ncbi:MAG: alanine racemase [Geminicoccaceae bacterium]|nr:alanine racemase [Geminicoccaceae bacterium]MDW8124643.1 alanine racemase [Geminicoccaceae bacterium]
MREDARLAKPRLEIDLEAIVANWRSLARMVAPAECAAVVKADAYGLGLAPVARALARAGCRTFFVARPEEGAELRALLPAVRILVLDGLALRPPAFFLEARLAPVLGSAAELRAWRAACRAAETAEEAALLLDTGLTRLGSDAAELAELGAAERACVGLLASHLACADEPEHPLNRRQRARLVAARALFPRARASLAASSGIFLGPAYHFDLVRPGAALFGLNPTPGRPNPMRPVVRLIAPVLRVHEVREAGSVGYGAEFPTRPGMRIAVVPVGYADGYPRAAGGRAKARIAQDEVPVVGRVSMDLLTLDVSGIAASAVAPGTPVELLGPAFDADALAAAAGTIGYEILTRLGRRFERCYRGGEAH